MRNKVSDITVAVLPFQYLSETGEFRHFSIGFTEDLIIDLSKFDTLNIISNHSTRNIDDPANDKLLNDLNADYILTGSFRHYANNLRIRAQLIRFEDNSLIWADRFDEDISKIFAIQDEIIQKIVSNLQKSIDVHLLEGSREKNITNLEAYACYLQGMEKLKEGTVDADVEARKYFEKALESDPNYSRAISGMSLTYFNEWSCQLWDRWDISQKGAHEYAQKAVAVNENDYVALMVLGRTNLYLREYDKAEHYLRKSLRLNPNDADNLIQIASCMIYLGYKSEAGTLLEKALRLNPLNRDWYNGMGCFIYYNLGEYRKSIEMGLKAPVHQTFIDLSAFLAGSFFEIGKFDEMARYWGRYLEVFKEKINKGKEAKSAEAAQWMLSINPYRNPSQLKRFLDHISEGKIREIEIERSKVYASITNTDGIWKIHFDNVETTMQDAKGLQDIATLLKQPYREIRCLDLMGAVHEEAGIDLLDERTKTEIRKRITSLSEDIQEAESFQDYEKASLLRTEYDQLVDHLSGSLGLKGKSRQTGSSAERARSAVSWRLKSAIKKIEKSNPSLARHLKNSIKTGSTCMYSPETLPDWKF